MFLLNCNEPVIYKNLDNPIGKVKVIIAKIQISILLVLSHKVIIDSGDTRTSINKNLMLLLSNL